MTLQDSSSLSATQNDANATWHQQRKLIVLSGPTAVGKGTVEAQLLADHPEIWVSISATTRAPRPGEQDGVNYHFMSEKTFLQMEAEGKFLETARVHNMALYGTPLEPVLQHLHDNIPTILEIDLQGARRVLQRAEELQLQVETVFLAPPTFEDLVERLAKRGTETQAQREQRLATARIELAAADEFDTVIVNDDVQRAADALFSVIDNAQLA